MSGIVKHDPVCEGCANDCKQPVNALIVSCPHFKRKNRNLEMFDKKGNIRKDLDKKLKAAEKKPGLND